MDYLIYIVVGIIALFIVWLIFSKLLKNKKIESNKDIDFDVSKFINALGGPKNIREISASGSRITILFNTDLNVIVSVLKQMGASGVVMSDNKITLIMGSLASSIVEQVKEKM